jgi:hypothetical protein
MAAINVPDAKICMFRCPMKKRASCLCCVKTIETSDALEDSQTVDKSAFLKVKQTVAIVEGAGFAPQQSATALRQNMAMGASTSPEKAIDPKLLRSIQHLVKTIRLELTIRRLFGSAIDDSFGNLLSFSVKDNWNTLIQQTNVAEGGLHLDLLVPVVIAHEFDARDIIHINISSTWWLLSFPRNQLGMGISIERRRHIQFLSLKSWHDWILREFSRWPQTSIVLVAHSLSR